MNTEELLKVAQAHCPEMVEKTASALYLLDRISPEHVPDVLADFDTIAKTYTEKSAKVSDTLKDIGGAALNHGKTALGLGAAGLLVGAVHAVGTDMYDAAKRGLTAGRNFKRVLAQNPDLLEKYEKKDLKKVFDTVHRFGPEFTADPFLMERVLAAGMDSPDNIFGAVQNIIGARKNLQDAKRRQFTPGQYNANAFVRQDEENTLGRQFQAAQGEAQRKTQRDLAAANLVAGRAERKQKAMQHEDTYQQKQKQYEDTYEQKERHHQENLRKKP